MIYNGFVDSTGGPNFDTDKVSVPIGIPMDYRELHTDDNEGSFCKLVFYF